MRYPYTVDFDGYENAYVADTGNHRIQFYPRGSIDRFPLTLRGLDQERLKHFQDHPLVLR